MFLEKGQFACEGPQSHKILNVTNATTKSKNKITNHQGSLK
jgi:hypothetical protein